MLGLYLQQVIDDQGMQKALDYCNKVGYAFGSGTGVTLKEKFGKQTPTTEQLKQVLIGNLNDFGQDYEISAGQDRVDVKIKKCPFYDGLSSVGMTHDVITQFCKSIGSGERAAMKDAVPELEPFSTPMSKVGDVCLEGYKIKK